MISKFEIDNSINSFKNSNRPPIINNVNIIKFPIEIPKKEQIYELKENLLENYDFVALPKKIYKLFKKWYNIDFEIIRYVRPDPTQNNKMVIDLYPGIFNNIKKKYKKKNIKRENP